jgi:ATP-dependent protease ClpP protease subunit
MKPTAEMADEARRGLEWRAEYNRGGTAIGVARARDISNRANLSPDTIRRMVSYFARHEVDKEAQGFRQGEKGYPSAGRIAWALWGGDAGKAWANKQSKQLENMITIKNKAAKVKLNDQVDKFSVDKVIEEISKVYGMKAVENHYAFGEILACADNAVDTLEIEIHTGGGSVFEGGRIYNELKNLRARGVHVTARINTLAASMGSVIAMGADTVEIASNGKIMIHEASGGAHGNAADMSRMAKLLDGISDEIAQVYADKTGKTKDEMRELMKKETWMSAKETVSMGFADSIFDTKPTDMGIMDKFKPDAALIEKVTGLEASLKDSENQIAEITSDLETAISELITVKAQLDEATKEKDEATKEAEENKEQVEKLVEEVETLKKEVETATASADARAIEIASQAGLAPLPVSATETANSNFKTRSDFNAMSDKEKMKFSKNGGRIIN